MVVSKDFRAPQWWEMKVLRGQPREWVTGNIIRIFDHGFCLVKTKENVIGTHIRNLLVQEETYFRKKTPYQVAESYGIINIPTRPVNIGLTVAFDKEYITQREKGLYCAWGISHDILMKFLPGVDPKVPSEDYHMAFFREYAKQNVERYKQYLRAIDEERQLTEECEKWSKLLAEKCDEIANEIGGSPEEGEIIERPDGSKRKICRWKNYIGVYRPCYVRSIWDDPDDAEYYLSWQFESGDNVYDLYQAEFSRRLKEKYPQIFEEANEWNPRRRHYLIVHGPQRIKTQLIEDFEKAYLHKFAMRRIRLQVSDILFNEFEKLV